jgi:hypothetical protein
MGAIFSRHPDASSPTFLALIADGLLLNKVPLPSAIYKPGRPQRVTNKATHTLAIADETNFT